MIIELGKVTEETQAAKDFGGFDADFTGRLA